MDKKELVGKLILERKNVQKRINVINFILGELHCYENIETTLIHQSLSVEVDLLSRHENFIYSLLADLGIVVSDDE